MELGWHLPSPEKRTGPLLALFAPALLALSSAPRPSVTCPPAPQSNVHFSPSSLPACLQLPPGSVDVDLLHDATRREARGG